MELEGLLEHILWPILLLVVFCNNVLICKCVIEVSYNLIYENVAGGLDRASEKHTLLYGFHIKLDKASYLAPRLLIHRTTGISREFWQGGS